MPEQGPGPGEEQAKTNPDMIASVPWATEAGQQGEQPVHHGEPVTLPDRSVPVDSSEMSDFAKVQAMKRAGMTDEQISAEMTQQKNPGEAAGQ